MPKVLSTSWRNTEARHGGVLEGLTKIEVWSLAATQKRKIRQKCILEFWNFDRFLIYHIIITIINYHYYCIIIIISSLFVFFWSPQTLKALIFWNLWNHMKSQQVNCPSLSRPCLKAGSRGCDKREATWSNKRLFPWHWKGVSIYLITVFCLKKNGEIFWLVRFHSFVWKTTKNGEIFWLVRLSQTQGWWCQWRRLCSPWWILILNASGLPTFWRRFWCRQGDWVFLALDAGSIRFLHRIDRVASQKSDGGGCDVRRCWLVFWRRFDTVILGLPKNKRIHQLKNNVYIYIWIIYEKYMNNIYVTIWM